MEAKMVDNLQLLMLKLMDKKDHILMTQMQQEKTSVLTKIHKKWFKHQTKNQFQLKLKVLASTSNLMTISKSKLKQKLTLKNTNMSAKAEHTTEEKTSTTSTSLPTKVMP